MLGGVYSCMVNNDKVSWGVLTGVENESGNETQINSDMLRMTLHLTSRK